MSKLTNSLQNHRERLPELARGGEKTFSFRTTSLRFKLSSQLKFISVTPTKKPGVMIPDVTFLGYSF
jgi:hypothetical protein